LKRLSSSISAGILYFALFIALIVGAGAPAAAIAQDSYPGCPKGAICDPPPPQDAAHAPAAKPNADQAPAPPASAGNTAPSDKAKNEDAEGENAFRHTPLVSSISDMIFRDDPHATDPERVKARERHIEITARGFEWINFLIIALCIVIPLVKFLPRVFRKRSETLRHQLETARQTTADANARLSAVEAQMAHLDVEIAAIRAQVEEDSKQDEVRIKASIEEEKARIVAAAEQEIAAAAAHAQRGLRHFAADLAIEQAARQIILTPETDRALIAEFISETAGNGAASPSKSGGQN
jgi:F-type H+-transporting ATPase subunit b